jgi:hypothetical protein
MSEKVYPLKLSRCIIAASKALPGKRIANHRSSALPRQVSGEGKDGKREKNGGNPLPLKGGFAGAAPCEDRGTTLLCYHNQFRQRRATVTTVKTAQKKYSGESTHAEYAWIMAPVLANKYWGKP